VVWARPGSKKASTFGCSFTRVCWTRAGRIAKVNERAPLGACQCLCDSVAEVSVSGLGSPV